MFRNVQTGIIEQSLGPTPRISHAHTQGVILVFSPQSFENVALMERKLYEAAVRQYGPLGSVAH